MNWKESRKNTKIKIGKINKEKKTESSKLLNENYFIGENSVNNSSVVNISNEKNKQIFEKKDFSSIVTPTNIIQTPLEGKKIIKTITTKDVIIENNSSTKLVKEINTTLKIINKDKEKSESKKKLLFTNVIYT
jgi:hypothetical protein